MLQASAGGTDLSLSLDVPVRPSRPATLLQRFTLGQLHAHRDTSDQSVHRKPLLRVIFPTDQVSPGADEDGTYPAV